MRGLAPQRHGGQEGPYLGSAEERGSLREAAGGGEGHSLLQELLQLRRAGLGLRLRQAVPQPAAWGARLRRDPGHSRATRSLGSGVEGGNARVDGSILHPQHFGRILFAPGFFFCGGKAKAYLFLKSRKGSLLYCSQSWLDFSRKGGSSATIRLRWGQRVGVTRLGKASAGMWVALGMRDEPPAPPHHSPCCPSRQRGPWWSSIPPELSRRCRRAWRGRRQGGWAASVPAQTGTWSGQRVSLHQGCCSERDGGCFWHFCAAPVAAWWHKFP